MSTTTYTQEPDLDLVAWVAEIDATAAAQVAGTLTETTIGRGEDTICAVCEDALPAGAPAWKDRDGVLCAFCAETELDAAERTA